MFAVVVEHAARRTALQIDLVVTVDILVLTYRGTSDSEDLSLCELT